MINTDEGRRMLQFDDMDDGLGDRNRQDDLDRKKTDEGRPMLKFKDMDDRSIFNPAAVTKEKFSAADIKKAAEFVKIFATSESKKFLRDSQFGNDPIFVEAVLDCISRIKASAPEASPLKFENQMEIENLKGRGYQVRERLEQALFDAQNEWISRHGPLIQNGQHPLDQLSEFTEGFEEGGDE